MVDGMTRGAGRQLAKTLAYGLASLALYVLLYVFAERIMALSALGGWYFLLPVAVAFVFSFAHGAFTAHFWDLLGVKAKG